MTDFALERRLRLGEVLTQDEVESVFNTNFGYQFRGITLRSVDEGRYVILMANEGEIYEDEFNDSEEFIYEGEGVPKKGDQKATPANSALIDAIEKPIPIYLFTSQEGLDEYEYRGVVSVEDCEYVSDGERMLYRFKLQLLGLDSWGKYQGLENKIEQYAQKPPSLTEDPNYQTSQSVAHSVIFANKVKSLYGFACVACESRRFSPHGTPEVEATRIYPKSRGGPDDLRNGLSLCKLHHWAFDAGWFSITDDLRITVRDDSEIDPPEDIQCLSGESVLEPNDEAYTPHPKYLEAHRNLHQFE